MATQAILADEVADVESAEQEKVGLIDETTALVSIAAMDRETAVAAGLLQEVADTEEAKSAETALVEEALTAQGGAAVEHRAEELEATAAHEEEKEELFAEAQGEHLLELHTFWIRWLGENNKAMISDLQQMAKWLQQRQKMFEQAIRMNLGGSVVPPGGGQTDEDEEDEDDTSTTGSARATLQELRNLAVNNANTLGILTDSYRDSIYGLSYDDLVELVAELQEMVKADGRALGGGVAPGNYQWVGEDGPELVRFNQAARIDPAALFRNQPPAGVGGGSTSIDQSVNAQFTFPDPRGIPPTYIAAMKNIAAGAIKKSLRNRGR